MSEDVPAPQPPLLRVVNPDATPEEIAAIVAVFSALGGSSEPAAAKPVSHWSARHRKVRRTYPHGAGGWRGSSSPR